MLKDELIYWINEREAIRKVKEAGLPKPWSNDPIFQNTYFCNVHREDDRVTRWIDHNWRGYYPHPNYELGIVLSRLINKPSTLEALGFPEEWDREKYLTKFRSLPSPKWGNAYVITTHGQKMDKDDYVFGMLADNAHLFYGARKFETCADAYYYLMEIDGLGSFLAAQIIADLKNTRGYPLATARDREFFSAHGPGSLRGLSWFWEITVTPKTYAHHIRAAWEEIKDHVPYMDMQDLQNCFCEFDKYCRVKNGTGRSKRLYAGA